MISMLNVISKKILSSFAVLLIGFSLSAKTQKKMIFLGDSLTEGYGVAQEAAFPQILQKKFEQDKSEWQILASGSSGSTSASTLSRLKWLAKDKPDVVFILMGSNDGLRGLKVEETEKNLAEAIDWAKKNNIKIILGQLHVPPNYGKDYDKKFTALFPRLAKKHKVPLAPFLLIEVAGQPKLNQPDGIHPNEKGHAIIAENMYRYLKKQLNKM
jgi:acyl-CoA thioesterase-1